MADLAGDLAPLQYYVEGEAPHGIADSFLYGVSMNKIAAPIDELGNLFVLPSGSDAITEEILRSPRWAKLANGFRQEGALLLLVAPRAAAGLDTLVAATEGAVLVGDTPAPASWPVIAAARPPRPVAPTVSSVVERRQQRSETPAWARRLGVGAALLALAAVGAVWVGRAKPEDDSTVEGAAAGTAVAESETEDGAAPLASAPVANPEDSASAAAWTIQVLLTSVEDDARLEAARLADSVAGVVVSPVGAPIQPRRTPRWSRSARVACCRSMPAPASRDRSPCCCSATCRVRRRPDCSRRWRDAGFRATRSIRGTGRRGSSPAPSHRPRRRSRSRHRSASWAWSRRSSIERGERTKCG